MTVFENIAFPLRVEKLPEDQIIKRVRDAAAILQLDQRLQQKPGTLSGGQRQRVAIGRAIVRQPKIFLFDEPLSNLDAALRSDMRIELLRLHKSLGTTMIYVTHDQVEAMTMADKIVVLNAGVIEQVGSPLDLYENPKNVFVAGFIGSPKMNLIQGKCISAAESGLTAEFADLGVLKLPHFVDRSLVGKDLTLGIRPEAIKLSKQAIDFTIQPTIVERLGIHTIAYSPLSSGRNFISLCEGNPHISENQIVTIGIDPKDCHLFDEKGLVIAKPS